MFEINKSAFGTFLAERRKEKGYTQKELAAKLFISDKAVSKWERAEASPDTDNLIALAKLYHVSLDELLKINEEEETDSAGGVDVGTDGIAGGSAASAGMRGAESEVLPVGMRGAEGEILHADTQKAGESMTEQAAGSSREGGLEGTGVGEDDVYIGLRGIHVKSHSGEEDKDFRQHMRGGEPGSGKRGDQRFPLGGREPECQ